MSEKAYPLPNVPRGFRRLLTGDKILESDLCDNRICKPCVNWEPIGKIGAAGMTYTKHHFPMIRAKPAPANAKIPEHVLKNARELAAMGDAAKAKAKAKRAGKPVKAAITAKRRLLGNTIPVFVLPADADSVARMVAQVAGSLEPYAKFPEVAARTALAALGIRA